MSKRNALGAAVEAAHLLAHTTDLEIAVVVAEVLDTFAARQPLTLSALEAQKAHDLFQAVPALAAVEHEFNRAVAVERLEGAQ